MKAAVASKTKITNKIKKTRKKRLSPIGFVILGIILFLAVSWTYKLVQTNNSVEAQRAELLQKKQDLVAKNESIRNEIEKLNTPEYIEQLAREKIGLVRKGEIMVAPKSTNQ